MHEVKKIPEAVSGCLFVQQQGEHRVPCGRRLIWFFAESPHPAKLFAVDHAVEPAEGGLQEPTTSRQCNLLGVTCQGHPCTIHKYQGAIFGQGVGNRNRQASLLVIQRLVKQVRGRVVDGCEILFRGRHQVRVEALLREGTGGGEADAWRKVALDVTAPAIAARLQQPLAYDLVCQGVQGLHLERELIDLFLEVHAEFLQGSNTCLRGLRRQDVGDSLSLRVDVCVKPEDVVVGLVGLSRLWIFAIDMLEEEELPDRLPRGALGQQKCEELTLVLLAEVRDLAKLWAVVHRVSLSILRLNKAAISAQTLGSPVACQVFEARGHIHERAVQLLWVREGPGRLLAIRLMPGDRAVAQIVLLPIRRDFRLHVAQVRVLLHIKDADPRNQDVSEVSLLALEPPADVLAQLLRFHDCGTQVLLGEACTEDLGQLRQDPIENQVAPPPIAGALVVVQQFPKQFRKGGAERDQNPDDVHYIIELDSEGTDNLPERLLVSVLAENRYQLGPRKVGLAECELRMVPVNGFFLECVFIKIA
mmetsp:Transcript_72792/g.236426  ORF Transcript_72792/g.236426 Transcript_72792/m.236426 type:complete len:531 (+) Transcript_72792:3286-4878(+)